MPIEERETLDQYDDPAKVRAMRLKLRRLVEEAAESAPRGHREAVVDMMFVKLGLVEDRREFKRRWLDAAAATPPFSARPDDRTWRDIGMPLARGGGSRSQEEGYQNDWVQRALVNKPPGNFASVRKSPQDWKIVNLIHRAGERPRSPHFLEWFRYGPEERGRDIDTALDAYASSTPNLKSMFTPVAKGADEHLARAMGFVPAVSVLSHSLSTTWSTVATAFSLVARTLGQSLLKEENEDVREYLGLRSEGRVAHTAAGYHAASRRLAVDHGPTFPDWREKARPAVEEAFAGVREDDGLDWFAIAREAISSTLPHTMYRGFSVRAKSAAEAKRAAKAEIGKTKRALPHSFSKAVARSFALGVEPYWAAAGAVSDSGLKARKGKAGQWGAILSVEVTPDMVDWRCLESGNAMFGEHVYDLLPFDGPPGEYLADILVEHGGVSNVEWDLEVKPYPPESARVEVFRIAEGDTEGMEQEWREWGS